MKKAFQYIKNRYPGYNQILLVAVFGLVLVYTRFVNLGWGLPHPMHPDERNMALAIMNFRCEQFPSDECFNPHFFAYGQLPLYLAYGLVVIGKFFDGDLLTAVFYSEAVFSLRLISAISSVLAVYVMAKIVRVFVRLPLPFVLLFIFSPGLIQFAHFGTTESLLMLFNLLIIYNCLLLLTQRVSLRKFIFVIGMISGLAWATKVSSVVFLLPVFISLGWHCLRTEDTRKILLFFFSFMKIVSIALLYFIIFSPYNFITFIDFLGAMHYESDVATGRYVAFYIRQFSGTVPVLFQFTRIFPYALGLPSLILFAAGFLFLPYNRLYNILRISWLGYFLPTAFLFAKWTRFMSPIFPIMLLFGVLFLSRLWSQIKVRSAPGKAFFATVFWLIIVFSSINGLAFLSVYTAPDVRYKASEWVFQNIPVNSLILSETANVVDVPLAAPYHPRELYDNKTYDYISFNFYEVDRNVDVAMALENYKTTADYVFVPSRRVFMNHTCVDEYNNPFFPQPYVDNSELCEFRMTEYPLVNDYYDQLFGKKLGYEHVATFTSYPRITMFGRTLIEFPDELAEESWTVFDHPVFRIYKRI